MLRQAVHELERELGLTTPGQLPPDAPTLSPAIIYQLVEQHGSDAISIHAFNGDYLYVSPSCERLTGWLPEDLVGKNCYLFFHPDDLQLVAASHAAHQQSVQCTTRYRIRCKEGNYRWVETRSRTRPGADGPEQIVCVTHDVHEEETARLRSRAAALVLAEQERSAIVGGVIAALNHELNNPLMAAMLALDSVEGQPQESELLGEVRTAVARMNQVIRELGVMLKASRQPTQTIDLGAAADRVLALLPQGRYLLTSKLEPTPVRGAEAMLLQCLYHIAYSHVDATMNADSDTRIEVSVQTQGRCAEFRLTSTAKQFPTTVRANLADLAVGLSTEMADPMRLAEHLAQQLNGDLLNEESGHTRTTRLCLPLAKAQDSQRHPAGRNI